MKAGLSAPGLAGALEALRKMGDLPDRVFMVRTFRIQRDWAWVVADPQSSDGKQRYETQSALLRNVGGSWKVVDQPCTEESCNTTNAMLRIRHAHPKAPAALFAK